MRNSWTHLHIRWNSSGQLNIFVEKNLAPSGEVRCGTITTPLPTEKMYSLGHIAFPTAYFDNLAIWYQKKVAFNAPWNYISGTLKTLMQKRDLTRSISSLNTGQVESEESAIHTPLPLRLISSY